MAKYEIIIYWGLGTRGGRLTHRTGVTYTSSDTFQRHFPTTLSNRGREGAPPMPLFCRKKTIDVQSFILKIINNDCPDLKAAIGGVRTESRARVCVVVLVVPVESGKPLVDEAFSGVTKELSSTGLALMLHEPKSPDDVLVGFRNENKMHFLKGKVRHLNPMGGGFYQLGIELTEMVEESDYPSLASLSL